MRYVSFSGNTGAGKSTLLRRAAEKLGAEVESVTAIDEQLFHHRLLQNMFDDPDRWGLVMQLNFLVERAAELLNLESDRDLLCLMERSLPEDHVFFGRLVGRGHIDPRMEGPYVAVRDALISMCPEPAGFIFVNTDPEVCIARLEHAMSTGSRPVELVGDALRSYVFDLDAGYRKWRDALPSSALVHEIRVTDFGGPNDVEIDLCVETIRRWYRDVRA